MSLVGPRPPACSEFTQYSLEHLRRLDVTPGLTGLWQVTARQDPSFQNYIELDKEYVNNWSLGLDFKNSHQNRGCSPGRHRAMIGQEDLSTFANMQSPLQRFMEVCWPRGAGQPFGRDQAASKSFPPAGAIPSCLGFECSGK